MPRAALANRPPPGRRVTTSRYAFILAGGAGTRLCLLSGDHVYTLDYNELYEFHAASRALVTVAVTEVPESMTNQFGILTADASGRVIGFEEKPQLARSRLASMGVYLFDRDALIRWLMEDAER